MTIETKTAVRKLGDGSIPAAAALTGDEVVLGLQDGESVEIATQDIAALAGGATYAYSGTHSPTLAFSGVAEGAIVSLVGAGALAVSRIGSGAGVPSAGDRVVIEGAIAADGVVDGDTCDVPLPFAVAVNPYPIAEVLSVDAVGISATAALTSTTNLRITFAVSAGTSFDALTFRLAHQAANAVDP